MLGKKLRTEDDRIKAAAKARKKKRKKMIKIWTESSQTLQKGCLFLYLCSSDCLPGDSHDPLFVYE